MKRKSVSKHLTAINYHISGKYNNSGYYNLSYIVTKKIIWVGAEILQLVRLNFIYDQGGSVINYMDNTKPE